MLIAEFVEPSANFPPAPSNLTLSFAALMSVESCTSSAAEVLTICVDPENESKVDPSLVPRARVCLHLELYRTVSLLDPTQSHVESTVVLRTIEIIYHAGSCGY